MDANETLMFLSDKLASRIFFFATEFFCDCVFFRRVGRRLDRVWELDGNWLLACLDLHEHCFGVRTEDF